MTYHDQAPSCLSAVTSDGILAFFEDERSTSEDRQWFFNLIQSGEYSNPTNPISKYNWNKIKSAFAREFFPDIAPAQRSKLSIEDRMNNLFVNMKEAN